MASPKSSCSVSDSVPSLTYRLPVMMLRDKIVEKIQENRLTMIVGEPGCGKSSQVPQFLLEEDIEPIVCTQPRRFAVMAIARVVASARNCEVGDEVGYHIGHIKVMSPRTKIVFKTAGVLLEELLDKGIAALCYKVIILDEVHERSLESDLVLACVKQLMLKDARLRVVLMSATADIAKYRDYFRDIGRGERMEVLAIPSLPRETLFQRKVLYLEQVIDLLGFELWTSKYCSGPSPSTANAEIKPEMQQLVCDLVLHIHENEPDIEKSILIFLPTYATLEQQWSMLASLKLPFNVYILHSTVDTEKALAAMIISKSIRKVILATNIAESSVTIPGVAFVIDFCICLQVFWDAVRKKDSSELAWVSKSQAEQRKGRTGRTCDGHIYRLVTSSFYNGLREHELPSILRLSLRKQVLMVCCANSKAINDPKVLLQKTLDPPARYVTQDALSLLLNIHALEKPLSPRSRYMPTFFGRLLASLRLSFDASLLLLSFAEIGLLREGILLGVMVDMQPMPIAHPFGEEVLFLQYIDNYFDGRTSSSNFGKRETVLLGNFFAFQFWQRVYKDQHRLDGLKQIVKAQRESFYSVSWLKDEWCRFHYLLQNSLEIVSDTYEAVLGTIHYFRPHFLAKANGLPCCYDPDEFQHTCLLHSVPSLEIDAETNICCLSAPFVSCNDFRAQMITEKLVAVTKELRIKLSEDTSGNMIHENFNDSASHNISEPILCKFFMKGSCNRGNQCSFSHTIQPQRPVCKYFFTFQGCHNGNSCFFSHETGPKVTSSDNSNFCASEDAAAVASAFLSRLPTSPDECVLIHDDTADLHFSKNLSHYVTSRIIVTTRETYNSIPKTPAADVTVLQDIKDPNKYIISARGRSLIPWRKVKCVLWYARFSPNVDDLDIQHLLVVDFFKFLAIRILADTLHDVQVIITMNNHVFSQLQVEKLGRECLFFLIESFPFDASSLGDFLDEGINQRAMQISRQISYVFRLHPPSHTQFGDYSVPFWEGLYGAQNTD